jgi:pilus assembly protein Flp/PilA
MPYLSVFAILSTSGSQSAHLETTEFQREGTTIMLEFIRSITSRRDENGASAVEYGLLVAGIAALIVAIVFLFGGVIKDAFQGTCDRVKTGSGAAKTC